MRKQCDTAAFLLALVITLAAANVYSHEIGAAEGAGPATTRGEKDEIAIIKPDGRYFLEKVGEIHLEENDDQMINLPIDMDISPNGDIFIADYRLSVIHQYDSTGHFIRRIGGLGDGPGEFQDLDKVRVVGDNLAVYDARPRKMQFFDLSGKYRKTVRLLFALNFWVANNFDFSESGKLFFIEAGEHETKLTEHCQRSFTFAVCDSNFEVIAKAGRHDPYLWDRCDLLGTKSIIRTDVNGNVYVLPDRLPRVSVYSPDFQKTTRFNYRTAAWAFPAQVKLTGSVLNQTHSFNNVMLLGKKTKRIFILSRFYDHEKRMKTKKVTFIRFLSVLSSQGKLLLSEEIPQVGRAGILAVDANENIYFFTDNTPDEVKIGKYRFREKP